jgi:Zn-dependent protease/CBS domain-containing protein
MFARSFRILTIAGIDIKLDPSWFLIAVLVVWSLAQGYFPQTLPDATRNTYLGLGVVAMLGLFGSLVLHELAHAVVARRCGVGIKGITLFLFGGVAELAAEPRSASSEFWIAVAGPVMSMALSAGFGVLGGLAQLTGAAPVVTVLLSYLAMINLMLALFNMLPAFPLDGGRVYRALLWNRSGDLLSATRRATSLGRFLASGLILGGGALFLLQGQPGGLWLVLIGFFLLSAARATYQRQLLDTGLADKKVSALMSRRLVTVSPDASLEELVHEIMLPRSVSFVPVVETGVLLGYVDRSLLSGIDRENWETTRVGDVFAGIEDDVCVGPDMPVREVLKRMTGPLRRKLMVVDGHKLVGVICLSDLLGYLSVLQEQDRR